jgi:hypothetical protein
MRAFRRPKSGTWPTWCGAVRRATAWKRCGTCRIAERNADALVVRTAGVDTGPTLKRIQPHARGMGFMIKKRMSHITVSVSLPDQK